MDKMRTCSGKEWDTCRVEKMECSGCYYNNPPADEMFEKLGFEKETRFMDKTIVEELYVKRINNDETIAVYFYKNKTIYVPSSFENDILQAIFKKSIELWGALK